MVPQYLTVDQCDDTGCQYRPIAANAIDSCNITLNYMNQLLEYEDLYKEDSV